MINTNLIKWAILGGLVFISGTYVSAQDWPQWRGTDRDGKPVGFTAPEDWPSELTLKWKVTVGAADATPALVGDNLYVFARQGEEQVTLCLDAATGDELWRDMYAAPTVTGGARTHPGPRSSPSVSDGKVVTLGVGGILSCLDAATGEVLWRKDEFSNVVPQFFTGASPIIVDGICLAPLGGRDNAAVIAFDLATGDQKWRWVGDGPAYASPVLMTVEGTQQIVVPTEKDVVSVAMADGKLLWRISFPTERRSNNSATPIVDGRTVIFTGQGRSAKDFRIEKQGDEFTTQELWHNEELGTGFNTPVLREGFLFGLNGRGSFFCMIAQTGEVVWTDTAQHGRFGAILDAGSVILALPSNSGLIAYRPIGTQYEELARYSVSDTPIYAHPVIAGNRVFVKDQETVALWMIE